MPINASLVTLIGGRGSGKSILLDCVYKRFHPPSAKDSGLLSDIEPHRFLIDFTKQDGSETKTYDVGAEDAISYLHVRQGDIRRIAENPDALSDEIKRLLGIAPIEGQDQIGLDMESILEQVEDIKRWLLFEDENGQKINTKNFNEKIIKSNEERIKAITSKENKELVENYNNNAGAISRINTARQKLVGLKSKLTQFEQDIAREISSINSILQPYKLSIPQIDTAPQITSLDEVTKRLVSEGEELAKNNSAIQQQLRERGIEQDPAGLLDKVSIFQKAITEAQQRIEDIKSRTTTLSDLLDRRKEMASALMETLHKGGLIVNTAFSDLKKGRNGWTENQISLVNRLLSEVNITGEVFFDQAVFYQGLLNVLNGRKFRQSGGMTQSERLNAKFNVNNFNDFKRLLSGDQIIINDDDSLINAEQFSRLKDYFASYLEYLYLPRFQQRYLRVKAFIKYKNKDPNRLSVGQRGTFYVCMKLATDPFGSPFIFDQPEDDLDNDFIVRELVPLFKEIKKYRQIIIATHNANLVVNADAEQIIVASNEDEELSYISGALEDQEIRDAVCTILEGGEDAFLKRESKYDFG
jgi:ABC-type dipeptide/oligopeptide/nickel transport system ATPase component